MATWQLIEHASRTVVRLLEAHLALVMPATTVDVKLATPHSFGELKNVATATVSVFLYRVTEHPELRNNLQQRRPDGTLRRQPLVLELYYMITTWGSRGQQPAANDSAATLEEHKLLGAVMQGLYDAAEVSRAQLFEDSTKAPVWGVQDSLQITLDSVPIEDIYRIFDPGELAYQLSTTYRVRVLGLESSEDLRGAPVVDAAFEIGRPS